MIWTIVLWISIVYLAIVILSRLFIAVMMVLEGYAEMGTKGALTAAAINFLVNLWDFGKFALTILILVFVVRSCRSEKTKYAGENKELDTFLVEFGVIGNETRQYAQTYIDLLAKYRDNESASSYAQEDEEYRKLRDKGTMIISKGPSFEILFQHAKASVQNQAKDYLDDTDITRMINLLLEQVDVGKDMIDKSIRYVTVNNELIELSLQVGSHPVSSMQNRVLAEKAFEKYRLSTAISDSVNQAKRKFDDLNYERLKIYNSKK